MLRTPSFVAAMLLVAAIVGLSLPASAQTSTGDREREGAPHRLGVEGTLASWRALSAGDPFDPFGRPRWHDRYAGGVGVYARIRVGGDGELALAESTTAASAADAERVRATLDLDLGARAFVYQVFRIGNLFAGVSGGARTSTWSVRGGGGLGLPVASAFDPGGPEGGTVLESLLAHGAWDAWLVLPDVVPVVVRGDATYDIGPFFAGVEVGASLMPFVAVRYEEGPSYFAAQLAAWAGGRIEDLVALGVRGQVVGLVQYDGPTGFGGARDEEGFAALVPFVRLELARWTVEARGTIHLDDPYGVFADGPRNWSLRFQFGFTL